MMAQDEFVDLYELLNLPLDAEAERIRKRINELYLEAQRNLDHRNIKKRLRYQQMYELYLPQARHLLLDPERRTEYDRYLEAYRSHQLVAPASQSTPVTGESAQPRVDEKGKGKKGKEKAGEADSEKTAVEREQLWTKWKSGLETPLTQESATAPPESKPAASLQQAPDQTQPDKADEKAVPASNAADDSTIRAKNTSPIQWDFDGGTKPTSTPGPSTRSTSTRSAPSASTPMPAAPTTPPAPTPPAPAPPAATARTPTPPSSQRPASQRPGAPTAPRVTVSGMPRTVPAAHETSETIAPLPDHTLRQEQERFNLIREGIELTGTLWGFGTGLVLFVLGCLALLNIDGRLAAAGRFPFGLTRIAFNAVFFLAIVMLAVWFGWVASRAARKRASADLSLLSEESLRRRRRGSG